MVNIADFALIASLLIIFTSLFLLWKRGEWNLARKILASIFVAFAGLMLGFYSHMHGLHFLYGLSYFFYKGIGYLLGPLFLIYIKSLFEPEKGLLKRNFPHFIPFIVMLLLVMSPKLITWGNTDYSYINFLLKDSSQLLEALIQALFFLTYCSISLWTLRKFKEKMKYFESNLEGNALKWIQYLIGGSILAMSIDTIIIGAQSIFGELQFAYHNITLDGGVLTIIIIAGVILFSAYYGLSQTKIFLPAFLLDLPNSTQSNTETSEDKIEILHSAADKKADLEIPVQLGRTVQFAASENNQRERVKEKPISEEKRNLIEQLQKIMETQRPYLEEDLTLRTLATYCGTTDKKLSGLINGEMGTNFYDYINGFRVQEFIGMLKKEEYQHYTLLAMAFECGFKSKSSFNRIFKNQTQLSPSQYKAQYISNDANSNHSNEK